MAMEGSEAPCFEKLITERMLQKSNGVMIPVSFMRTHGHRLQDSEVSLTGPSGRTHAVSINSHARNCGGRQRSGLRVYLGHAWNGFARENGFQTGECVRFKLLENSTFRVLVLSKSGEKVVHKTPPLSQSENERRGLLGTSGREADRIVPHVKATNVKVSTTERAIKVLQREFGCNSSATRAQSLRGLHRDQLKHEAAIPHRKLPQLDYVKHPGLDAAIAANSGFPSFISKLSRISVHSHDIRLELPYRFVAEYGDQFQARVDVLGPNGHTRRVGINILHTGRSKFRVQFRDGWRAFSAENGFSEGDALLFSLVAFSKFRVQVFPVATH